MMGISEYFESARIAYQAIIANKTRAFLTSLGIVIGIFFVIMMGWFLDGLDNAFDKTINAIGTDMLYVDKWSWGGSDDWRSVQKRKPISYQQALEASKKMTTAELVAPHASKWGGKITYQGNTLGSVSIVGVTAPFVNTPIGNLKEGRFFSETEDVHSVEVVILGYKVANAFFPDRSPLGEIMRINGRKFLVIGVVNKRGTIITDFIDNQVFIPIQTFMGMFGTARRGVQIAVKAGSQELLDEVRGETRVIARQVRNLQPGEDDDFTINESQMFRDEISTLRLYVWGIGIGLTGLSFFVGIIGIMNIMFVSVTERTKEIGIRKALGAKNRSIMWQFLVESSTLCLFGAFIGFLLCATVIFAITSAFPDVDFLTPYVPLHLLFIASIVSIIVGIFAGLIPAYRASRLDPVEALRYE